MAYVSKIRDPRTGQLLPLPPSARGKTRRHGRPEVTGDKMRSTKWFKVQALRYAAAAAAGDRHARAQLAMVQMACHLFLEAKRAGLALDDAIALPGPPTLAGARRARREARQDGAGQYHGMPCPSCGGTLRFSTDGRCALARRGARTCGDGHGR